MDIKIVHIVLGKANPNKMNGVSKVVNELATYQTNLGYDVSIWGITRSLSHNYPPRNYYTELFLDEGRFRVNHAIKTKLKNTEKNTVFHFHGGFIPQFYFLAKILKQRRFKYIFTPHGAYNKLALERSKYKKKFFLASFDKYITKHAENIHFIGQSEVDNGKKLFGNIPYVLIPNGQPLPTQNVERMSQNEKKGPVFGFMGRLDIHTKGLDLLFQGFKEYLVKQGGTGELWVIGDGEALPALKEMAQNLGIYHCVNFLGSLFGKEKEMVLKQLDIFCLTSRNEGLPGVVLEAASFGVPSVVSLETNMGQYISKHRSGWVLQSNSVKSISKTLKMASEAFQSSQFEDYRNNAFSMLKTEFNWKNIAMEHIKNYEA